MTDFEIKRKEYLKKITTNARLFSLMAFRYKNNPKLIAMIISPENESELELGNNLYKFCEEISDISFGDYKDNTEYDYSNSINLKLYIELINAFRKKQTTIVKKIYKSLNELSPKKAAKYTYDFYMLFANHPLAIMEYIAERCGFNTLNQKEEERFNMYFDKAHKIINKNRDSYLDLVDEIEVLIPNNKDIALLNEYYNEFHNLYIEGKKLNTNKR